MNKKQEITLDAVSSISEEYINEVTEDRVKYSANIKRGFSFFRSKRAVALVASLFLIVSSVLAAVLLIDTKQIPVYEGMTVSSEAPTSPVADSSLLYSLASELFGVKETPELIETKPLSDTLSERFGTATGKYDYYANKHEDVYITVHIDNPDGFEILSFTLNGVKYSSYMFEAGSDLENLVLKVNVGDADEVASYTIDAIKYVDGNKIKDVKMEGDETVEIGISGANLPTSTVTVKNVKPTSVELSASISDTDAILALSEGKLYAIAYDGATIVAEKELSLGDNEDVSFTGLTPNTTYKIAVVAVYDAYDGQKISAHLLASKTVSLDPAIYAEDALVNRNSLSFSLSRRNEFSSLLKIELVDSLGNVVDTAIPQSPEELRFTGLSAGEYLIRVYYTYETDEGTVTETKDSEPITCTVGATLIEGGTVIHPYSGDIPIYNPSTNDWREHFAVDVAPTGEDKSVHAVAGGVVSEVGVDPRLGNFVYIKDSHGYTYHYCSLDEVSVEVGAKIGFGDVVGTAGECAAEVQFGEHVHFFIKNPEGEFIDPHIPKSPVVGNIVTPYSKEPIFDPTMNDWREHLGVDIVPTGSDNFVYSITAGVVSEIGENAKYGKYIAVTDSDGYTYYYCSLDTVYPYEIGFAVGIEAMGTVGDSMVYEVALGEHLHIFLKDPDSNIIDPGL